MALLAAAIEWGLNETLLTVITLIMLGGIPWAYGVHGRLTSIESSVKHHDDLHKTVEDHEHRIIVLEQRK